MTEIRVEVRGLDKVMKRLSQFPGKVQSYLGQAGHESSERIILPTQGLKKYPPATAANRPPTPFYVRGRGMQYANRNDGRSERYGTQFYVKREGYNTKVGNRSSYARYLTGEETQASHMAAIGWRKLIDVAREKKKEITDVYQRWVNKLIKDLGL